MGAESPKREHGGLEERAARVALGVRSAECTRVDVGENVGVGRQAGEGRVDTPSRARVYHEEAERCSSGPGKGEASAAAPVGEGDSPDKAPGGQTPGGCGVADAVVDGEEAVEAGNGVLDALRGAKAGDVAVVVGVEVEVVVADDDDDATVVAGPAAGPAAGPVVVAVVVAAVVVVAAAVVVAVAVAAAVYA